MVAALEDLSKGLARPDLHFMKLTKQLFGQRVMVTQGDRKSVV